MSWLFSPLPSLRPIVPIQNPSEPPPRPPPPPPPTPPARARVAGVTIQAEAGPGGLPPVVENFAKRGLLPRRWVSDVTGPRGGHGGGHGGGHELAIDVQVAGLDPETQAYIARCLRQIWGVGTVLTSVRGGS